MSGVMPAIGRSRSLSAACLTLLFCATTSAAEDARTLAAVLIAGLEANATKYPSGALEFELERGFSFEDVRFVMDHRPRPPRLRAKLIWSGDDAMWAFRREDPDKAMSPDHSYSAPLESAAEDICLATKDRFYIYRNGTNTLYIGAAEPESPLQHYLDLRPSSFWFHRQMRSNMESAPWTEMIGPDAQVGDDTAGLDLSRVGDRIVQLRTRTDGSISRTTFDLSWDGNVVEHYVSATQSNPNQLLFTYEWARDPKGRCVLKRYEFAEHPDGKWAEAESYVRTNVLSVGLDRPVSPADVSLAALQARLPANAWVQDNLTKKRYFLNPEALIPTAELDRIAEQISGEGFLDSRD